MPRPMCGISPRRRSGTSLRNPCPNDAMTRDRDTPHAPDYRSIWHGLKIVIPSSLRGSAGAWVLRVTASSQERTISHPGPAHGDPIRLTATRSPREGRHVWRRRVLGLHVRPCQTDPTSTHPPHERRPAPCHNAHPRRSARTTSACHPVSRSYRKMHFPSALKSPCLRGERGG